LGAKNWQADISLVWMLIGEISPSIAKKKVSGWILLPYWKLDCPFGMAVNSTNSVPIGYYSAEFFTLLRIKRQRTPPE
jgi:hypothetical protein